MKRNWRFSWVQWNERSILAILLLLACFFLWSGSAAAQQPEGRLKIQIARPSEGETFYSGESSLVYSMFVKGYVSLADPTPVDDLSQASVRLQVWQDGSLVDEISSRASKDGRFSFSLTVNAENSEQLFPPTLEPACIVCHFVSNNHLPAGEVLLKVIASLPDGSQASDERKIYSDQSGKKEIPVRLVLAGEPGRVVPGVIVQATTRLYNWRGRTFLAKSAADGVARLKLESLSEAPTHYLIRVNPVIVDGVRYTSTSAAETTLEHGAAGTEMITLELTAEMGSLSGKVNPSSETQAASTLARLIHLPDGQFVDTALDAQGEYQFSDVPLGKYLVLAGASGQAWMGVPEQDALAFVNLAEDLHPKVDLSLPAYSEQILQGRVVSGADSVPFAWVRAEKAGVSQVVDAQTGEFAFHGLPQGTETLLVSAPGYYSQVVAVQPGKLGDGFEPVMLKEKDQTQKIAWGSGAIIIPPESLVERGANLVLRSGWLFGKGDGGQAITLRAGEYTIDLQEGRFALEYLPNESAWFMLFEGQAQIGHADGRASVQVSGGQMINLQMEEAFVPVAYDWPILAVLRGQHQRDFPPTWEPTVSARFRDAAARLGVGAAQGLTYASYLVALGVLLAAPVYYFVDRSRNRKKGKPVEISNIDEVK